MVTGGITGGFGKGHVEWFMQVYRLGYMSITSLASLDPVELSFCSRLSGLQKVHQSDISTKPIGFRGVDFCTTLYRRPLSSSLIYKCEYSNTTLPP